MKLLLMSVCLSVCLSEIQATERSTRKVYFNDRILKPIFLENLDIRIVKT